MSDEELHGVVDAYFAAMRQGGRGGVDMLALFTDDAVYEEPLSGAAEPAIGIDAIGDRFRTGWATPLPDMELEVLTIEVTGNRPVSRWECRSSAFPAPVRGCDVYELRGGRIASLHVTIE